MQKTMRTTSTLPSLLLLASFAVGIVANADAHANANASANASAPHASGLADEPALERKRIAELVAPSFVIVEVRFRQDRGELPQGRVSQTTSVAELVGEERPLELPGFLLDDRTVVVRDTETPARFIESIRVRSASGGQSVSATPTAWFTESPGVLLTLEGPIKGARPVEILPEGATPEGTLSTVRAGDSQGIWTIVVAAPDERTGIEFTGAGPMPVQSSPTDAITVDAKGRMVRCAIGNRRSDSSLAISDPRRWPNLGVDQMKTAEATVAKRSDAAVLRTTLHFRSPRKSAGGGMMNPMAESAEVATELETLSVLLKDGSLLVLADLAPSATARLERIDVVTADGATGKATFTASLRDWGAFIATPEAPLTGGVELSVNDLAPWRDRLLFAREIRIVGRARVSDPMHTRPGAFDVGWHGIRFPMGLPQSTSAYLFAHDGTLAALPIARREQPGERDRWSRKGDVCTPSTVIASVLANRAAEIDPSNIPLSASDESRTGWLGVLMQPLEPELARDNGVAELSRDGEFGGIVTFVYPNSPAAKAGVQPGMILLTITTPRRQRPIEISLNEYDLGWGGVFPWDKLDGLPEEAYDQVPPPWPPIDDSINAMLTELGIGSHYQLEWANNGTIERKELTVEQSPPHFTNAPKAEVKELGLTVRDLTIEVRQYLSIAADAPGVVVSKLEPGQRASVAGLRPFEIIESVDSVPVANAEEFAAAIKGKSDMKLTVKRAQRERVVKVTLDQSAAPNAADPAKPTPGSAHHEE